MCARVCKVEGERVYRKVSEVDAQAASGNRAAHRSLLLGGSCQHLNSSLTWLD